MPEKITPVGKVNPDRVVIMVTFAIAGLVAGLYAVSMYPVVEKVRNTFAAKTVSSKLESFLRKLD
jgi:hypothetical protein